MADPRYQFTEVHYQAITPVHVGAGQDVGVVDLPVIRERTTDHPFLPGSGLRGALRARCRQAGEEWTRRIFGHEDAETAGCLSVLDAQLVLFPVRSTPGLFHWITCPFVLRRWAEQRRYFLGTEPAPAPPTPAKGSYLGGSHPSLHLEEYRFDQESGSGGWLPDVPDVDGDRIVLLHDEDFRHFVRHATDVRQRNRLSTAKTVLDGHLFSVEAVPAESWFAGFLGGTAERSGTEDGLTPAQVVPKVRELLEESGGDGEVHLMVGGDESVGYGLTRMLWREAP